MCEVVSGGMERPSIVSKCLKVWITRGSMKSRTQKTRNIPDLSPSWKGDPGSGCAENLESEDRKCAKTNTKPVR